MSLPYVAITFAVVTIPVALISFFKKIERPPEYISLSDFKKLPTIFHSGAYNSEMQQYREIDCDKDFVDIWNDDNY
jgi:hypothetical protein